MATLTIELTGLNPASGVRVRLGRHENSRFDDMDFFYLGTWMGKVLDKGLETVGASGLDELRPWRACLSMALWAGDEENFFRPAFHVDARTISMLSAAGAAFYFDPLAFRARQNNGEKTGEMPDGAAPKMAKLEVDFVGLHPVTGTGVGLAGYRDPRFGESDHASLDAWINKILDESLQKAGANSPDELRPWHACLSMAFSADSDEKFRPAFYLDAKIVSRLSAAGAAFDFDPYV